MDFSFTEEQTLLRNTVQRFVTDQYDFETRRKIIATEEGRKPEHWAQFAELGLLAVPFDEEHGGLGYGPIETMVIMEELGRGLVVEPYLQTVVTCGGFLRYGGTDAQKAEHIPAIAGGEKIFAFAYAEPQGRFNLADLKTTAKQDGDDFVLSGYKAVVHAGPWADMLVVTARTSGGQRDEDGISVFLVDAKADGVARRDYPTVDGLRASEITFDNVKVSKDAVIGEVGKALSLIEKVVDETIAALAAESIGAMKVLNDTTVDYCKTRTQFGVPIGKFQVLQHRMVDMFMEHEQSVSMTYMAHLKLGEDEVERKKAASAVKVQIGKSARFIGQNAVQLHGGMGMTDELNVGHFFKRLTMVDALFGNTDHHLKRYAALSE